MRLIDCTPPAGPRRSAAPAHGGLTFAGGFAPAPRPAPSLKLAASGGGLLRARRAAAASAAAR